MSAVRRMIDAIAVDNFDGAREALKASLADYMAGRAYVSNSDLFGQGYKDDYANPNIEDELKMVADLNGGVIRKHDKTGDREESEENDEYTDQLSMRKKKLKKRLADELEESKKVLWAVYGDKIQPGDKYVKPVMGKTFKTEDAANKFQDQLWNSPDWHQYATDPRELVVDIYEE